MSKELLALKVKTERLGPIRGRHPWVFSGGLEKIPDGIESGTPVKLVDERGDFLAQGYFNAYSQIAVRVWSYDEAEKVDADFFASRIESALNLRQRYIDQKKTDAYRLINSENDGLPGLIVDKYADHLVVQCHTRGIELWKEMIVAALVQALNPAGIYERSDAAGRKAESMDASVGLLFGEVPERVKIKENGFWFWVDIKGGQKTGFFLDQRDKRQALLKYAPGRECLNCFSYTGGFSVYALAGGAAKVTSVDVSAPALDIARDNILLNKLPLDRCEFVCTDAKQYLKELVPDRFDLIILDPPAFIKDRHKKHEGISGYKGINQAALRALPADGILVSCSCSAHLSLQEFRYILSESAGRSDRTLQILETYTHGLDHPQLAAFTEGEYLKTVFARAL
jgi:23S rRNA (cytosine1962-C5)-methyltransferase